MKELLEKLSSYNIFNFLLPGTIFVYILKELIGYNFIQSDFLFRVFLYYFIGMIISRCGSVFIEPFLKWVRFLKYEDYKNYISASKLDPKIDLLLEVNNSYRTLVSMFLLLLISKFYKFITEKYEVSDDNSSLLIVIALLLLLIFSYRKQTNYVVKRIKANNI